jgi:S-adenosylmethionine hydrolase
MKRQESDAPPGQGAEAVRSSAPSPRRPIVTLLTDFGHTDPFVGIMKGVILTRCPDAVIVDLCHEVAPQQVLAGAFLLHTTTPYFPPGTVHIAVVDPGVGSARRALAARIGGRVFLTPDNGLLSYILEEDPVETVRVITARELCLHEVSATFHGRDVFASVAGHLARGVALERVGPEILDPVRLLIPRPRADTGQRLVGEVLWIDRFGNAITSIHRRDLSPLLGGGGRGGRVTVRNRSLGSILGYFAEAGRGAPGALIGGSGHLELFIDQGNLADAWGISLGDPVVVEP